MYNRYIRHYDKLTQYAHNKTIIEKYDLEKELDNIISELGDGKLETKIVHLRASDSKKLKLFRNLFRGELKLGKSKEEYFKNPTIWDIDDDHFFRSNIIGKENKIRVITVVDIVNENGAVGRGVAFCSLKDNFSKRIGRMIAKFRAICMAEKLTAIREMKLP